MPPKKNTAKKRAAGGIANRVSGPLGSPVSHGEEVLQSRSAEPELPTEIHSLWCMICHDGAEGDVVLYKCDACLRIMCSHCIEVPAGHLDIVQRVDVFFFVCPVILSAPSETQLPTFANLPEQGGRPVLPHFLQLNGNFETASCTLLASTPIAIIHFIIGANDEVITPVPLLSHYLQHFYPNGGYTYLEIVFDVATHQKIDVYTRMQQARVTELRRHLGRAGCIFAFFSDHSEQDSGWLFAGKVNGKYIAMSVSQVLSTVFSPYVSLLKAANMVFLVCGSIVAYEDVFVELKQAILDLEVASAIIFPVTRFQPLVATNFLLAMAELVIVEQLDLHKVFPALLSLSNRLGQHSKVILMTKDDAITRPQLSVTTFARAHTQTQPWGIEVPAQCPLCGSTNSWSEKVGVTALDESQVIGDPDQATVARYIYTCTHIECDKSQGKPPHRFHVAKPPGFLVSMAKSKRSGWFQSPSTIFPPPPSVQSSPILPTSSITEGKRLRSSNETVEMTVSTRKRAHV
ncbi:hypothetical protein F4604DRAFT_1928800 [Suillus subluteus]|nr:hypothetical protein F4604DRAFT_1928800 [Suillus subluteus]